jgi:amidase
MLSPVFPTPAPPHGEIEDSGVSYTVPASLTSSPSATVRCGSQDNLPIGVQLMAAPWKDHVVIEAAGVLEEALGGWAPPTFKLLPELGS